MKKLVIVDLSSFIFRAYYAIRPLTAPNGKNVNAVYGVLSMLLKLIEDEKPNYLVMAKDVSGPNFRHQLYKDYKANRSAPPEELSYQFPLIDELIGKLKLAQIQMPGFEADDIIGSIVVQNKHLCDEIIIVSSDKDLMQFVHEKIFVMDTKMEQRYDSQKVFEKMGVRPDQIVDYLSLVGDSSDNIPGVSGIGAVSAKKLLGQFESLENCLEEKNLGQIGSKKIQECLKNNKEMALLSKSLVTIKLDLNLGTNLEGLSFKKIELTKELRDFLTSLGFKSQITKLESFNKVVNEEISQRPLTKIEKIETLEYFCKYFENFQNNEDLFIEQFRGNQRYFVMFYSGNKLGVCESENCLKEIFCYLREKKILLVSYSIKQQMQLFGENWPFGITYFDLSIAQYGIDPTEKLSLQSMYEKYGEDPSRYAKEWIYFENLETLQQDVDLIKKIVSSKLEITKELFQILKKKILQTEMENIFYRIDNPMVEILFKMEQLGIGIDAKEFEKLDKEFSQSISTLQNQLNEKIQEIVGNKDNVGTINFRSPKQLSHILFDLLQYPKLKKIKTGYSTDSQVLEELIGLEIGAKEIPQGILQLRELEKLLNTYIQVLPTLAKNNKIHTSFNLNLTQTGRLSSEHPNLQNIPVKTSLGRKIRNAFVSSEGFIFLSLDYSQIELRILAHMSQDEVLLKAFRENTDVHKTIASQVFNIPLALVSAEQRNLAKTVNFGLIYGQGSLGLSKTLKIPREKAKQYIEQYFLQFPKIKAFLDSLKEKALEKGYCETILGRKRYLPDLSSSNMNLVASAQRLAVNSPIQGTAADLIKLAMIRIEECIQSQKIPARMILQIHDELIFEVLNGPAKEDIAWKLSEIMEQVMDLTVPLKVDQSFGMTWGELF